ncbi:hypothetical protein A5722_13910 [Mycobacterium vulneris]|nr:hypothetical protein A5722_13910 [Mycolicibacterium vulneris]OCB67554.1 hypothetical protein A5729_01100 [Mycolicibacterium vulneris]
MSFAARVNLLFDSVHPPGRGPYRDAEVADGLAHLGYPMSRPYLSQLRSGRRTNPSETTIHAFAEFFRVDVAYFTDDEYYLAMQEELSWLRWPRDGLVAELARGLLGLSKDSHLEVIESIERRLS